MHTYRAHPEISVIGDYLEVPGLGFLAVNAFVIHAAQPVVVDTGLGPLVALRSGWSVPADAIRLLTSPRSRPVRRYA